MIEFESDDRTCGEQLLLRVVLLGCTPAQLGWDHLDASDFRTISTAGYSVTPCGSARAALLLVSAPSLPR